MQVLILDNDVFAIACAAMFCWSGVLGLIGGLRTLLSHSLTQRMEAVQAVRSYGLKVRTGPAQHADIAPELTMTQQGFKQ